MKRIVLLVGLVALISAGLFAQEYTVGGKGPAGGYIFYDKGEFSDGWRYLEAAPEDAEFRAEWGGRNREAPRTGASIGRGRENTEIIVTHLASIRNERNRAAQLCAELEFGGFDDWFLPSRDELNQIFLNLRQRGIGGFRDERYWSSTQESNREAWSQSFNTAPIYAVWFWLNPGSQDKNMKQDTYLVRPVRAF